MQLCTQTMFGDFFLGAMFADSGICNTNWSFLGLVKQWINKTKTTRRTDKDWIFLFGTEKKTGLDFVQSSRPSPPPFSVWSKRTLRDSRASAKVGWRRKNGKCLSFVLYLGFCTLVVPVKANVPYFSKFRYKYSSSFFLKMQIFKYRCLELDGHNSRCCILTCFSLSSDVLFISDIA